MLAEQRALLANGSGPNPRSSRNSSPLPPPVALPSLTNRQPRALSHASEHPSPEGRRRGTASSPRHTFPRVHHRLRFRCLREARGYKRCRLTTAARRLSAPLAQQLATVSQGHERRRAIVTLACVSLRPRPRHALRCLRRSLLQARPRPTASAHRLELARQDFHERQLPPCCSPAALPPLFAAASGTGAAGRQ